MTTIPEDLTAALERARRALAILEAQAAGFGALHIPVHLQIELEEKRREVANLETRLGLTPAPPAAGNIYLTMIEHAEGLAIGDGAQVSTVTPAPPAPASDAGSNSALRPRLQCLDDVALDALCLDHFPAVYERFARGLRRDEKINLLLDYCHRHPEAATRLVALLGGAA